MVIHPISGVISALPRSDLLLLSCKFDTSKCELETLPVSPYPVQANTPVKAHFVALTEPQTEGWYPWIGGTWSKWITGTVLGYRDYAGREAEVSMGQSNKACLTWGDSRGLMIPSRICSSHHNRHLDQVAVLLLRKRAVLLLA
jgi:hypothetical protein